MRKFLICSFILIVCILVSHHSHAQRITKKANTGNRPEPGGGPATPLYPSESFLGSWEWRSGTEVFRLTLTRDLHVPLPNGRTMHFILGRHSYTRNGVVVEESYTRTPNDPNGCAFLGQPYDDQSISMSCVDRTKSKNGRVELLIDPSNRNQMQFTLREIEGMHTPSHPYVPGFTIPTSMTLTRVP